MKVLNALVAIVVLAAPGFALAQAPVAVPVLCKFARVEVGGSTTLMVLPQPIERYDASRPADAVLAAFDQLKAEHPAEYGRATLLMDASAGRVNRVTLNLDPDRKDWHDPVATEVYCTMRSLGVGEVKAPAIREAPLDDAALRTPMFRLVVPLQQALPPRSFAHALVVVPPGELVPSDAFYSKLRQGDRDLIEKILGGLTRGGDQAKLAVLAAIPHLTIDRKAARLLPLLDDPSSGVRLAVLKLLEAEQGKEVTDRLGRMVETDADPTVKLAAVRMLSARGVKKYDVFIEMEKLSDPSDDVVVAAIRKLAAARNPAVGTALLQSLRHRSPAVRDAARSGLVDMGANDLLAASLTDEGVDHPTREAIAKHLSGAVGKDAQVAAWQYLLASGTEPAAVDAAKQVGDKRPEAGLNLLYAALLRPEATVRAAAAKAVGAYRKTDSLKALLGAAKTSEDRTLAEAVSVEILASQPMDTVLSLMEGPDLTIRRLSMKAFGDSLKGAAPSPRAVAVLQGRLQDKDPGVRRAAVYALARVPDEKVASSMMALAGDPDPEIREAAVVAANRSQDPRAADLLVKALSDESDRVKIAALDGVAARRIKSARDTLQMMNRYQDVNVRQRAVKAYLALLDPGEAVTEFDNLSGLLYDSDSGIKLAVLDVVKQVHERRAIVAISGLVIDRDQKVKLAALAALAATGEKDALEGIEKAVFDNDKVVRLAALDRLAELGRKEALDFLNELLRLENDAEVKAKAEAVQKALLDR